MVIAALANSGAAVVKLPNGERALVPPSKLTGYLLSEAHPAGRVKAAFFRAVGFDEDAGSLFEQGLLAIARNDDVVEVVPSPYGVKNVVDGPLATPLGRIVRLRTVWIIEAGRDRPRLVTAYPA
jgi:hypothetical protein